MVKNEDVAGGAFRRQVHLFAAVRRGGRQIDSPAFLDRPRCSRIGRGISHDDFVKAVQPDELRKEPGEMSVIVPGWDKDAEPQRRARTIAHWDFFRSRARARSSARRSLAV